MVARFSVALGEDPVVYLDLTRNLLAQRDEELWRVKAEADWYRMELLETRRKLGDVSRGTGPPKYVAESHGLGLLAGGSELDRKHAELARVRRERYQMLPQDGQINQPVSDGFSLDGNGTLRIDWHFGCWVEVQPKLKCDSGRDSNRM
jgi:hypothetical protein